MKLEPNCNSPLGLRLYPAAPPDVAGEVKKEGSWNVLVAPPVELVPVLGCMSSPGERIKKIQTVRSFKLHHWK